MAATRQVLDRDASASVTSSATGPAATVNPPFPQPQRSLDATTAVKVTHTNPFRNPAPEPLLSQPSNYGNSASALPLINPFRTPKHTPRGSETSTSSFTNSPVSPVKQQGEASTASTGQRSRMAATGRKSVDLRKLDGTQYLDDEAGPSSSSRPVKVAKDMYAGEMPPGYEPQSRGGKGATNGQACRNCGGHKRGPSSNGESSKAHGDCSNCAGDRKMPPSSFPGAGVASEAGPSSSRPGGRPCCNKCGRRKRPESLQAAPLNLAQLQTGGLPAVGINVEPPTAINEQAPGLPMTMPPPANERPLFNPESARKVDQTSKPKPSRTGSVSSLFRSFSRRKQSRDLDSPLPSQQLNTNGEANSSHFIDKISSAIRDGSQPQYSQLQNDDPVQRPESPFSFLVQPKEDQAFEMNDMRQSKVPERRDSWDKSDENTEFLAVERPRYSRSQSTQTGIKPPPPQDDVYLALPADQRPGMTRFKSLRSGVNRVGVGLSRSASQISRSKSLKRLESVKKVPEFWYRTDMSLDGAGSEYNNYAY